MSVEQTSSPAFSAFPAAAGTTGPIRRVSVTARNVRVTLTGSSFTARVQVSNAAPTGYEHNFTPPDASFSTTRTVTEASTPTNISMPAAWVRVIVDAGSVTGGDIAESDTPALASAAAVQAISDAAGTASTTATGAQTSATRALNAIGNTALSVLATRGQTDGPQFVDGSRWLWSSTGTANGGTVVAGSTGYWTRESRDVYAGMYGAVGDGATNDAPAFSSALAGPERRINLRGMTYRLTAALTPPQGTALQGVRQTDYPGETAGATTLQSSASPAYTVPLGGTLRSLLLKPVTAGTGTGLAGVDKYFVATEDLSLVGFNTGATFSKALYHTHTRLSILNSAGIGLQYSAAAGVWNTDWYNNVIVLIGARLLDNAGGNLDYQGQGLIATGCDFTGGATVAFLDASSVSRKASVRVRAGSYDQQFNACYVERLPVGGFGYLFEGGVNRIIGGFAQGGTSAGANEVTAIVRATGGAKVYISGLYAQDYWTNLIQADGAGTVVYLDGPIQGPAAASGSRYSATNGAQIVFRQQVTVSGTIGAATGSTFTYAVPAGFSASFHAALSLNGGAIAGTASGAAYNTGSNTGAHGTTNSANITVGVSGSNLVITNNTTYGGTIALYVTLTAN